MKSGWLTTLIVVPIVILAIAFAIMNAPSSPNPTAGANGSVPNSVAVRAPSRPTAPPPPQVSEAERLRIELEREHEENARLKREMASKTLEQKAAPPVGELSIDEVRKFAELFITQVNEVDQKYWDAAAKENNKKDRDNGDLSGDVSYKIVAILVSEDVKHTDSAVNPLVGEVVFTIDRFMSTTPSFCGAETKETVTLHIAGYRGHWSVVSATQQIDTDSFWPETTAGHISKAGQVETLMPESYGLECQAVNASQSQ